jgi:hypothetical protein
MNYTSKVLGGYTFKIQEFDSISDFKRHIDNTPISPIFRGRRQQSSDSGHSFSHTSSYEEAEELLTRGWSQGAEKLAKAVPVKTSPSSVRGTTPAYSTVGHQASVPRYIMGVPTNMIDRKPQTKVQKIIVINKDVSFGCSVDATEIEREGIKALQIIQALEGKGYRVRLNIFVLTTYGTEAGLGKICIKKPEERMSLIKVAFPIIHPSMLRRIFLRWEEHFQELRDTRFTQNYGHPQGRLYRDLLKKGEYLLPNFIPDVDEFVRNMGL